MDSAASVVEAVAIKDGKIIALGDDRDILPMAGDATLTIDLEGHAVIPGLIEGHAHTLTASQSEYYHEIPEIINVKQTLQWIADDARSKKPGEWIIHPKFFFTRLEQMRQITKHELDSVAPENPVFLNGSYGGVVNSKAFEISGMMSIDHPGILRDEISEQPTGIIKHSAFSLLKLEDRENLTQSQQLEALKDLLLLYNSVGITSIVSGSGTLEEFKIFETLKEQGKLTVRVFHNMDFPFDIPAPLNEIREALQTLDYKTGDGNGWTKIGALKAVIDGGVLTGTAFLREPWGEKAAEVYGINDPAYRGELFLSKDDLVGLITAADDAGWTFTAHVTGGGGVDTLLAAFEEVQQSRNIKDKRFSIIHGNFFTPEAIHKMSELGIYANMQPAWFFKDTNLLNEVLGEERMKTFHPYRSMMEAGIIINGGSDHMVKLDPDVSINPYNPFLAMWSVITRITDSGKVFNEGEAISRMEALKMYTINNAFGTFEEEIKGSLEVGKVADLVVLSADILTCPDDEIPHIESVLTMVNGETVYENKDLF
jgi:predicted amidohydrolase YtcJ